MLLNEVDVRQLRALDAAVTAGTLDGAARALHVTPSAVSQRLRALESATGRVLLVRSRPVRPTPSGEALLRLARQWDLLVADAAASLGDAESGPPAVPVAISADALATWALPAVVAAGAVARVQVHRVDESRTFELLRDGRVVAAVTTRAEPVPGCVVRPLGAMRYRPVAAPELIARHGLGRPADGLARSAGGSQAVATRSDRGQTPSHPPPGPGHRGRTPSHPPPGPGHRGRTPPDPPPAGLHAAPVVAFDADDDLQAAYLRERAPGAQPPIHLVPASAEFARAVELGLGWAMLPDAQLSDRVRCFDPSGEIHVELFWQQWRLRTAALDALADAVAAAARAALVRPG